MLVLNDPCERQALYDSAYAGLDRDAGLDISEKSHEHLARVPGDGWFYGEANKKKPRVCQAPNATSGHVCTNTLNCVKVVLTSVIAGRLSDSAARGVVVGRNKVRTDG